MSKKDFDISRFFEDCGYEIRRYPNEKAWIQFYGYGKLFNVRNVGNEIQFANKEEFDRWANSVVFTAKVPETEKQAVRLYQHVIYLYENGELHDEYFDWKKQRGAESTHHNKRNRFVR